MPESYSSAQDFQRCPTKFYWRNIAGITRIKRNEAMFYGSEAHDGFKVFYLALQDGATQQEARNAFEDHVAERMKFAESNPLMFVDEQAEAKDMVEQAAALVRRYLEKHHDESWEILHVEERFTLYIDNGDYVVTFTPDLVVRDRNGFVWVIDWKTTKNSVPDVPEIPFEDLQALTYAAGVKPLYPELKGFIFVRLRKKTPTQPRLNKNKKEGLYWVNDLKAVDTTYDVLKQFIEDTAPELLKHPAHALRLAELRESDRFHWRETVIVTDAMIAKAEDELRATLDAMEAANVEGSYYRVYSPNPFDGCKSCQYQPLCRSELLGWNTESIIEEDYEPRDTSYKDYETEEEPF